MPISAPKPNSPPSVKRVDALTMTAALSTVATNRRAASCERVTIASVWPLPYVLMWRTASSSDGTTATARSRERYSVSQSASVASWTATPSRRAAAALRAAGVELRGDERARAAVEMASATEEDWATEYLALVLAVRVVDSLDEAIEHVGIYGSGHSEAIVTRDLGAAQAWRLGIDAACVYVNASTRFTDGGEFGMGAEIGNSTQKLHARGPIGLRELCAMKYLVDGDGQIRS